ncbi:hypothetical protein FNV43_RR00922 [Rhamnella rubrinervis]|uniref:Uncharacterized protein n=1 Tax=Rhamnella rubrinervis TaxID=2594499 RepID=A0A8K0HNP7_9ROSA|nr:hypothetical protein FNV43_RR00922 [Rhamnella rubrinervis]
MDPRIYVIREERRRVIVKRPVPPQLEEPVRVLVREPFAISSDEFAEFFHTKMAAHHHDDRPPKFISSTNMIKTSHGNYKQLPVQSTHNINVHTQRPPVSTQVQYPQPIAQTQQVSLLYHESPHYDQQASQAPHPVKNPAPGTVINSDEAAKIYGGIVIKDFGWNNKLPHVRAF